MKSILQILFFVLISMTLTAQSIIDELSFLEGNWRAEKWGGITEEYWSPPAANTIIGMFRFYVEDELQFTEHFMILEEEGKVVLKLRHFHPNFIAWEEKDEYVTFKLIEVKENFVQFGGLSFELVDPETLLVKLKMKQEDDITTEEFNFKRF